MSKHGPCYVSLPSCGPVVALWVSNPAANTVRLCQTCLDSWFDRADDGEFNEPLDWRWTDRPNPQPALTYEQIRDALTDPRNHQQVAEVLRRESRIDPHWLREFIRREHRIRRAAW